MSWRRGGETMMRAKTPGLAFVVGLSAALTGCASSAARVPLTEEIYQAAARHCHTNDVLRLRRGEKQFVFVPGASSVGTEPPNYDRGIECVERYLGVSPRDVIIIYQ